MSVIRQIVVVVDAKPGVIDEAAEERHALEVWKNEKNGKNVDVVKYSNHLNTRQVWYSNGPQMSICQMVRFSNGGLKTG